MAKRNTTCYAFLDTNIYLEFRDFEQIDWCEVLQYNRVCIVVAPITLTELERFKYDIKSDRRQSRSRSITRKLHDIVFSTLSDTEASVPGRANVTLLALTQSPVMTEFPGLVSTVADDELIASILLFTREHSEFESRDIILVADDIGCLNKARSKGIQIHRPSDELRLPPETSELQRENTKLKRQISDLQNRTPDLKIFFSHNDRTSSHIKDEILILTEPDSKSFEALYQQEVQATYWELPRTQNDAAVNPDTLTALQRAQHVAALAMYGSMKYSQEEIARYKQERDGYLARYKKYLYDIYTHEKLLQTTRRLHLFIKNDGTSPAQGVIIRLIIPDEITVHQVRDIPRKPQPIYRPLLPMTDSQKLMYTMQQMSRIVPGLSSHTSSFDLGDSSPDITPYNSTLIKWEYDKIMHNLPFDLSPVILKFDEHNTSKVYELKYELLADNLPKPVTGSLFYELSPIIQQFDIFGHLNRGSADEDLEDLDD